MAVYKWKVPGLIPVDAETAGKELTRIYERDGAIAPETLVNESRADTAPLHHCFEWDNDKAAEKYRISQAGNIIRHIVIENPEDASGTQVPPVRAFVHTKIVSGYEPIEIVISSAEKCKDLLEQATRDMQWFTQKYKNLRELDAVRAAMDAAMQGGLCTN